MSAVSGRIRRTLSYLRLRPFATDTEEGRAQERYRRAALTAVGSLVARGTRVAVGLLTVPLALEYLGSERYGMWLTMSTAIAVFAVLDLGISDGLVNALAQASAQGDREQARRLLSSAWAALLVTFGGLAALFLGLYPLLPWTSLYNLTEPLAIQEAGVATLVLFACWAAAMVTGLIGRANRALQAGYVNNLFETAASVLTIIALLVAMELHAGLPWLVLAFAGATPLLDLVNCLWTFVRRHPWLRPSLGLATRPAAWSIMRTGAWFLGMLVAHQIIVAAPAILVTHLDAASSVPLIGVPTRLFVVIGMVVDLVVMPLWPAYIEAVARGDWGWARRTLRRSIWLSLALSVPPALFLAVCGQWVLSLWVGDAIVVGPAILAGLATFQVLSGINNALGAYLNGTHAVRANAVIRMSQAGVALILMLALYPMAGIAGIVWGLALSEGLFRTLPCLWVIRQVTPKDTT